MPLTQSQRRHLKGLAHHLKPVVMIGQHGLTENVLNEIEIALDAHELIKVRVSGADRDDRKTILKTIGETCSAELVQSIGHVAVFFRRNREKPRIELKRS
jgi:RNA-binding protein